MLPSPQKKLLIGAHLSIGRGLAGVFAQANELECTTLQLFTKSNRQWAAKALTPDEISTFKAAHQEHSLMPIVAHASYLINIASPDSVLAHKSLTALIHELERCEALGIHYLVLHPGSHRSSDLEESLKRVAYNILTALHQVPGETMILLETMAGQGSAVGSSFEELSKILKHAQHHKRLGICLDTCHVFAAGYDFSTPEGYQKLWHDFDHHIGKHLLKVIHMNDSAKPCGSRVDRHCDIGKGKIGLDGFRYIMKDNSLDHIPKILETPKESLADDARNLETLRILAK